MNVGLLTFQYAINYGAVLQMYSLKKVIVSLGHNVEIINYIPSNYNRSSFRDTLRRSGIKKKSKSALNRISLSMKYQKSVFKAFDDFLDDKFKLSPLVNDSDWESIIKTYDCVVVGSDQVWNPTNQRSDVYFFNTSDLTSPVKISYAADSTNDSVQEENIERLRKALENFSAISVRNEHTKSFVEKITGKSPQIVADPVILSDFSEFCGEPLFGNEKYALVYILGKEIPGGHSNVISQIKEKYGNIKIYQVVMINQNEFTVLNEADRKIYDCTPENWVNLIYNAEFVYTDSFHCILFSAKFHKPFISYYADKNRAPRLISLQNKYGFGARIVSSADEIFELNSLDYDLDYKKIDDIFKSQARNSIDFLADCIKEAESDNG